MKNLLWKRVLSMVLLVCMLVGILPAGVSATAEAVDSRAGGSTLNQQAPVSRHLQSTAMIPAISMTLLYPTEKACL